MTLLETARIATPPLRYVVDGLFPSGSLTLFTGREKEGKSLAVLDLAAAVAAGEDWAGRATTAGPVVYCPAEDNFRTVRNRLARRIGDLEADGRPLLLLPLTGVALRPGEPPAWLDLNESDSIMDLFRMVRRVKPSLVILDCLRELHSARENESDDMTATMRPLRQLAHGLDVAVVVVHHASKGLSGSARGSTAIAAACDAIASWVTPHGGGADDDGDDIQEPGGPLRATLTVRGRDVPRVECRVAMTDDLRFLPARHAPPGAGAGSRAGRQIMAALADGSWRTAADIAAMTGAQHGTVRNVLRLLTEADHPEVERSGPGSRGNPTRYRLRPAKPLGPADTERPVGPAMLHDVPQPPGIDHRAATPDDAVAPREPSGPRLMPPDPWDEPLAG